MYFFGDGLIKYVDTKNKNYGETFNSLVYVYYHYSYSN